VFLIFCLNDISNFSATYIDRTLNRNNVNPVEAEQSSVQHIIEPYRNTVVEQLKRWRLVSLTNEYLRSHSKLYVLLKGVLTDPQARYWEADLQAYRQLTAEGLATALQPLRYIADVCERHNILFTVVVVPYEYQVRVNNESTRLPQQMLANFFETNEISYVDALPSFRRHSSELFLPYDPMHLSLQGHNALYVIISEVLTQHEAGYQ